MGDLISGLLSTPVPTILVVGGIVFIFLGLGGRITTEQIPLTTRKYFSASGIAFILIGVVLFAIPQENPIADEGSSVADESGINPALTESVSSTQVSQSDYDNIIATTTVLNQFADVLYGPTSGSLISEDDKAIECQNTDLILANSIIKIIFTYPAQDSVWTFGLNFRDIGANQEYRLFINNDGVWQALWSRVNTEGDSVRTTIGGGVLSNVITTPGSSNEIKLFTSGESAIFFLNDKYISQIDVAEVTSPGTIAVCIDYKGSKEDDGLSIQYSDFTIWSLP